MNRTTIFVLVSCLAACLPVYGQAGNITTYAGDGNGYSGDGGRATSAGLRGPSGLAMDSAGNLYIADTGNNVIRKVTPGGIITTYAGNGNAGFSGDGGPATAASLNIDIDPVGIAVDASGNLYIADSLNFRVRKVSASGVITTVAGNGFGAAEGVGGFSGDGGPATSAELFGPVAVAVDTAGNLFIADLANMRVRKVSATGIITTVAGSGCVLSVSTPNCGGFSGDGGPATSAMLNRPAALALDGSGNLFIADNENNRIRKVSASGIITTVAGIGPACAFSSNTCTGSFSGDGGPATSAALNFPEGLTVDGSGNLYIGDTGNLRVRRVSASGIITTIAGDGIFDYNIFDPAGDGGPATAAELNLPEGVFVDASGNIFISDNLRGRVREVFGSASPPSVPATGVTDGAGFAAKIAAGGIASIFGTNLAASTASAAAVPLARTLSGTTVTMNGMAVPLFFVSSGQINFQVPWELQPSPTANLTVSTAAGTSQPITVSLYPAAPGIFTINTPNSATQGAIQIANTTTFVAPVGALPGNTSRPALAGDTLTIFCSGLGAVTNTPASGSPAGSGSSLSNVQAPVSVTIGGQSAPVLFAGLSPGFVGLYQVNVQFPTGVASGSAVPVIVTTANLNSNTATIAVQ